MLDDLNIHEHAFHHEQMARYGLFDSRETSLSDGIPYSLPAIYKFVVSGTGTVNFTKIKFSDELVLFASKAYASVNNFIEYLYLGDDAKSVLITTTGDIKVTLI